MTRVVYVEGRYMPYGEAGVHVEDRGFQFADAVYEVCEVHNGCLVDEARHMARLMRSLGELNISAPMSDAALRLVLRETVRRNRVRNGLVYLQVSRGRAPRDFLFPDPVTPPTLVCLARSVDPAKSALKAQKGIAVKTVPESRWARCDLKTVMLLPACLAKEAARRDGAQEAWFVDEQGYVTEGASSNAWIVQAGGVLVTRALGADILSGVTRAVVLDILERENLAVEERPFTVAQALAAREAFVTSASGTIMSVVKIDGRLIGTGVPGAITLQLRSLFHQFAQISSP